MAQQGLRGLMSLAGRGSNILTKRLSSSFTAVAAAATEAGKKVEVTVKSAMASSPRHDLMMLFTCNVCEQRSMKTMSRQTYEKGVVIARCGGCKNHHLIADNYGWFGKKGNIEDFLAERGVSVKTATQDTYEFDLDDFVAKREEATSAA